MKLDDYHKILRERAKRYREAQKKSGRKQRQFFLTEAEFAYLKEILKKIRDEEGSGQALADEFGDFEALYEEVVRLRKEVAKGDEIIGKLLNEGHAAIEKNKQLSRLLKGRLEKALNNN